MAIQRLQIVVCLTALLAVVDAQYFIRPGSLFNPVPSPSPQLDLSDIASAAGKCDTKKLQPAASSCTKAIKTSKYICPTACREFFDSFAEDCVQFLALLGLQDLAKKCGVKAPIPSNDPPAAPALPPGVQIGYYIGNNGYPYYYYFYDEAPAPAPAKSKTPPPRRRAPAPAPAPEPAAPPPSPVVILPSSLPKSCATWYTQVTGDGPAFMACTNELRDDPKTCGDACHAIYDPAIPDETCVTELKTVSEVLSMNRLTLKDNPCVSPLVGSGNRIVPALLVAVVAAVAALMVAL